MLRGGSGNGGMAKGGCQRTNLSPPAGVMCVNTLLQLEVASGGGCAKSHSICVSVCICICRAMPPLQAAVWPGPFRRQAPYTP